MYGVIGEDPSDVETLEAFIKRLDAQAVKVKKRGYGGCGEMLRKGAKQLRLFQSVGCNKFVICYDSDRDDPEKRKRTVYEEIIKPAKVEGIFCALVPIQEIEAWILADINAVKKVITSWRVTKEFTNPESVSNPKEELERLSRVYGKPLYVHAIHNPKVASHLNIDTLKSKCKSFLPLVDMVIDSRSNI